MRCKKSAILILAALNLLLPRGATAEGSRGAPIKLQSTETRVSLLELYSSEGCSSCPPAEAWLTSLRKRPGLWTKFVPLQFHVDYWDGLGWADAYARAEFTARQRNYASAWGSNSVYTPGFVFNGREARPEQITLSTNESEAGVLTVESNGDGEYLARFSHAESSGEELMLNAALLGNGIETKVQAGENAGRVLRHDFVVLTLARAPLKRNDNVLSGKITLKSATAGSGPSSFSVVFWVTRGSALAPLQVVAGDLSS